MWHFELFKKELKVIMVVLNYEKYGLARGVFEIMKIG